LESDTKGPELHWEVLESHEDKEYGLFSVRLNKSRSPRNGKVYDFQILTSPDWVAVIPVTPDNKVVMVRQFRHGSGRLSLEPPGGLAKDGQTPEKSAREELEEETGYVSDEWELLCRMDPMPALFDNQLHVYLAKNVRPTGRLSPDETEDLETILIPVEDVKDYIRSGKITSSVMIAALYHFLDAWSE
jgi:ADP-ribose diphosphatase